MNLEQRIKNLLEMYIKEAEDVEEMYNDYYLKNKRKYSIKDIMKNETEVKANISLLRHLLNPVEI